MNLGTVKIDNGVLLIEDKNSRLFVTVDLLRGLATIVDPENTSAMSGRFPRKATQALAKKHTSKPTR